jgi:molecular chaperone GrpE
MTDESSTVQDEPQGSDTLNDPRFEVKWRKKSDPPRPATATGEGVTGTEGAAPADLAARIAELESELAKERERVKELQDKWQRAAADLVNLRRRTESERGDMEQFASMHLVAELLPVLDNFERAIATIPGNLAMLTWIQGVMLIQRHFEALLQQRGVAPIEAKGQAFSPHYHEAVSERVSDEAAPGTVLQEYQKGYTMHGRVIRPTLVEIASAPAAAPETEVTDEAAPEAVATETDDAETIASEAATENEGP